MLELLTDSSAWLSFLMLTVLEIVLGIDNIVFLAILVSRLPPEQQRTARLGGLGLAMLARIALLLSVVWLITLTAPLFRAFGHEVSARTLILGAGGLFLLAKSVLELHASVEHPRSGPAGGARLANSFAAVLLQIAVLDLVFSLDSVFTAVGLAQRFEIMVAAIVLAALLMMLVVHQVSALIERHPTIKVLALGFLILIGVALLAEALEFHIPKAYLYFAMAFALGVEVINLRVRRSPASGVPPAGAG
ncbi:MAG TPA: TerC family protein [Steroidobacteraceae bacterium]|nr:TerC family protein [Steroidobacteraceae bacterium]